MTGEQPHWLAPPRQNLAIRMLGTDDV